MNSNTILLGADKGGFAVKEAIAAHLRELDIPFEDVGTVSLDQPLPFTGIASEVGARISAGQARFGILACGTGMGMAIAANKFKGVYAAVVESEYAARYCRKINDANVLCLGGFLVGPQMACEIADTFLNTEFVQDFPQWSIDFLHTQKQAMRELEDRQFQ